MLDLTLFFSRDCLKHQSMECGLSSKTYVTTNIHNFGYFCFQLKCPNPPWVLMIPDLIGFLWWWLLHFNQVFWKKSIFFSQFWMSYLAMSLNASEAGNWHSQALFFRPSIISYISAHSLSSLFYRKQPQSFQTLPIEKCFQALDFSHCFEPTLALQ